MIQVRNNVFETNSSSTHSLTMCSKNEYDAWKDGKVLLNNWTSRSSDSEYVANNFVTVDEAVDILKKSSFYSDEVTRLQKVAEETGDKTALMELLGNEFSTYKSYMEHAHHYEETFEDYYVTKSGETIIAFGYYGYD